jgi:hypothetical protein
MSFTLVASSMIENTRAATPAPTSEPTATPEPTQPLITTSKFAYEATGEEYSSLQAPNTITLCNYTTPPDTGIIVQISICLTGIPEGSNVRAVIFPNEPDANFPLGGEPLAQSSNTLNVASVSGEWYNFTMNYPASQNTVYWLGYYSDNFTRYFFDANSDHISVTSQPKDENSQWFPVVWHYQGKTIMSLYAQYTVADPQHTPTPSNTDSAISGISGPAQSFQDTFFVLLIMGAEFTIVVTDQNHKKKEPHHQTITQFQRPYARTQTE